MKRGHDAAATWLQSKGWRQGYHSTWSHDTLSPHGALATDQAVRAQTRADRAAATTARDEAIAAVESAADPGWMDAAVQAIRQTLSVVPASGIIQAIEKADAAGATNTDGALSHQPVAPGGEHV